MQRLNSLMRFCFASGENVVSLMIAAMLGSLLLPISASAQMRRMYWSGNVESAIFVADIDGLNIQMLIDSLVNETIDVDVNDDAGHLYWANLTQSAIYRSDLDGSNTIAILTGADAESPTFMALDAANEKIYWSSSESRTIKRADLDGGNIETIIPAQGAFGFSTPAGIALDLDAGRMYWADSVKNKILTAPLGGGIVETAIDLGGGTDPTGLVLDTETGDLYWTEALGGKIQTADPSDTEPLIIDLVTGLIRPRDLEIDFSTQTMFWTDSAADVVQSAPVTGGAPSTLVSSGIPYGIALSAVAANVSPDSVDALRGFVSSGTLDDVLTSDDSDLCFNPGITITRAEAPVTLDFTGTLTSDSPSMVEFSIESSANTSGLELTISFWNYDSSSWDIVGIESQTSGVDTVRTYSGTPASHVQTGTAEVKVRYEVRAVGTLMVLPWLDCIDHVYWNAS